jgi:uncharacterized membrane protein
MKRYKRYLLTGLVIVVPVFLTLYVLVSIFNFLDGILGRFLNNLVASYVGFYVPGIGFMVSLLLIVGVGIVAESLFKHRIAVSLEKGFSGLPLVRTIYPALKQVVLFVSQQEQFGFKKVVLVEYPRQGCWSLGFLTNEQFHALNRATSQELVSVFIATTPGPMSGMVYFFPKEQVLFPAMSVNEALNIIISGGVFKGEVTQKSVEGGQAS